MNYYKHLEQLCDYIKIGKTAQQVTGRYRAATARTEIETDHDFKKLWDAQQEGLERCRKKKRKELTR